MEDRSVCFIPVSPKDLAKIAMVFTKDALHIDTGEEFIFKYILISAGRG